MSKTKTLVACSILLTAWANASCTAVECGDGTIETDGVCAPADDGLNPPGCAFGTSLIDGECVPDYPPTICDADTTVEDVDEETGLITCIGTGTGGDCTGVFACPGANANKVTVCGQLIDAEDNMNIANGTGTACPADGSGEGPCSIKIEFYDAVQFANMPQTAPTLSPESIRIDDCGRFRAENIPLPGTGFLGIGVDDADASGNSDYVLSGVALPVSSGLKRENFPAYVVRTTTDEQWTTDAGNPFGGSTFNEVGVYLPIFINDTVQPPVYATGVVITGNNGNTQPNDDYYFSDTTDTRSVVAPAQTSTGANGSGLFVNTMLVDHSGIGGEPAGCVWEADLAAAIATVVFAQERYPVGGPCD